MQFMKHITKSCIVAAVSLSFVFSAGSVSAQGSRALVASKQKVIDFWTGERRASAIPRDFVIDPHGLGYMKQPDGSLQPYGHQVAALGKSPMAKPGGGSSNSSPPNIVAMDPGHNATIGSSYTFAVDVSDESGVKSVNINVQKDGSISQSFSANSSDGYTWNVSLSGFTDGQWSWWVTAKDNAGRGGNTVTSGDISFLVDTGSGSSGSGESTGDTVTNTGWDKDGAIQTASGRIYFQMPANSKWKGPWNGYVCSGTVATDNITNRSIIITAAHCVYDDVNKAFARNVLFIPNQDGTTGAGTDTNCSNDPIGCWVTSFGVVDENWTTRTFPDNIPWDYAYYVVNDSGAHSSGMTSTSEALDTAAGSIPVSFDEVYFNDGTAGVNSPDFTYALGYSYSDDPNFMYCAEDMTTEGADNWWLPSCGLSGGSSGGSWVQPMDISTGDGDIISVNSWGYTTSPGMAGPKLYGTSAFCLFEMAKSAAIIDRPDGEAGYPHSCN